MKRERKQAHPLVVRLQIEFAVGTSDGETLAHPPEKVQCSRCERHLSAPEMLGSDDGRGRMHRSLLCYDCAFESVRGDECETWAERRGAQVMIDAEELRPRLVDYLRAIGCQTDGKKAQCPLHDDHEPSLNISERNGNPGWFCQVCKRRSSAFRSQVPSNVQSAEFGRVSAMGSHLQSPDVLGQAKAA